MSVTLSPLSDLFSDQKRLHDQSCRLAPLYVVKTQFAYRLATHRRTADGDCWRGFTSMTLHGTLQDRKVRRGQRQTQWINAALFDRDLTDEELLKKDLEGQDLLP